LEAAIAEAEALRAARSGGPDAFPRLVEPYRRELLVHCYRILGSLDDAEDLLQETLLRAWGSLAGFEGRASLRSWLYKIATNACLDALTSRRRRILPTTIYPPSDPLAELPAPVNEPIWLQPLPDWLVDDRRSSNPAARYDALESVQLAFLVALQHLPGRQRAVLILRDVLGFNATDVADQLTMTSVAVNSALQRARATLAQRQADLASDHRAPALDDRLSHTLRRYVEAWEEADVPALVALLQEDAIIAMPPFPVWFRGRANIRQFLDEFLFAGDARGRFRLVATRANGCPAFAVYSRDESGAYRPSALQVLTLRHGLIAALDDFLVTDDALFTKFGLPPLV
jgi:RNA polymerase sigma-70 factor (ECF subfamily)